MRALLASLALFLLLVAVAPAGEARPLPVQTYPCFNGGTTVVVEGHVVLECFQAVEVEPCVTGGYFVRVGGSIVLSECEFGPPPP